MHLWEGLTVLPPGEAFFLSGKQDLAIANKRHRRVVSNKTQTVPLTVVLAIVDPREAQDHHVDTSRPILACSLTGKEDSDDIAFIPDTLASHAVVQALLA